MLLLVSGLHLTVPTESARELCFNLAFLLYVEMAKPHDTVPTLYLLPIYKELNYTLDQQKYKPYVSTKTTSTNQRTLYTA